MHNGLNWFLVAFVDSGEGPVREDEGHSQPHSEVPIIKTAEFGPFKGESTQGGMNGCVNEC